MKNLLIITAILLFSVSTIATAQTEKGNFYAKGASDFSFLDYTPGKKGTNEFMLQTNTGYFLVDNFLMSLGLSYSSQGAYKNYGVGIQARGYANNFFVGMGYSLLWADGYVNWIGEKNAIAGGQILLEAGYALFLNKHIALEPTVSYLKGTGDFDQDERLAITLGLSAYF